ncbi:Hypothetical protein LUCI_4952 [Lucifera butyrica]|uniref:Uncharacterized protein n=1 Tax=Lucifera butyrica TaxID=1351585 RepID=A0A498RDT2_9FIRM|nr:hypothetical protein [Lucifera butyrica]VBB09654.1 Hypothetical protein LUCI_4952 [Lucifera butyrica]
MTTVKKTAVILTVVFILGIGTGVWGANKWRISPLQAELATLQAKLAGTQDTLNQAQNQPPVIVQGETKTQTQVVYVPKETIKYIDPKTKQEITRQEGTDVQADIQKPAVNVKVNGQDYKFDLLQGETQKFQTGKVVMDQTSSVGVNITVPPIDRTKKGAIGIGYGSHGIAEKLDINQFWYYHDRETNAGGVQYRF